jgi:Flp pilus assembly protein TadG
VSRRARNDSGATALEFGLVFPVVILLILGILQYGWHFWGLTTAKAVAREAARRSIVGYDWTCTQAEGVLQAEHASTGSTAPVITRVFRQSDGGETTTATFGSIVEVTVTFQSLNMHVPFLPIPNGGVITQTYEARVENVPTTPVPCDQ